MNPSAADVLRSLDLFSVLEPDQLSALAARAVVREFEPGAILFHEGQPCDGLWVLAEGLAQIVKTTPKGRQFALATQQAPAAVAEVPVFDGGPYPASVVALRSTTALLILRRDLLAACHENPQLAIHFLRAFGMRLRHLVGLAERVTFGTIRQRLAADLLEQAKLAGSSTIALQETHEQWAARLGTVREVISRNLGRFQAEGFLRADRRAIELLNPKALAEEADTEM